MSNDNLSMFWDTAVERQEIWRKKEILKQERPWTDNVVMQKYSMTNTYRLLDPGTRFVVDKLLSAIYEPATIVFNVMLYRVIGRESTYAKILDWNGGLLEPHDELLTQKLVSYLRYVRDTEGMPPFSKAYTVNSFSWAPGDTKIEKFSWQAGQWGKTWKETFALLKSCLLPESFFQHLSELNGIGRFISSQTYVDCTYETVFGVGPMGWSPEFYDYWMAAGPGAIDGLSRLFDKSTSYCQSNDVALLRRLHEMSMYELDDRGFAWATHLDLYGWGDDLMKVRMSIQDIQNWCCEFSKYNKLVTSPGKSRRTYIPRHSSEDETSDVETELVKIEASGIITAQVYAETAKDMKVGCKCCGKDVTHLVGKFAGYPVETTQAQPADSVTRGDIPYLNIVKPDPAKYDPKNSNTDPMTELCYHMMCGIVALPYHEFPLDIRIAE